MTNRRYLLAAGLAAALAPPAFAQQAKPVPAKLTVEQQAMLDKATA